MAPETPLTKEIEVAIQRIAAKMNPQLFKDLTQEMYLKVLTMEIGKPENYYIVSAKNEALTFIKRFSRLIPFSDVELDREKVEKKIAEQGNFRPRNPNPHAYEFSKIRCDAKLSVQQVTDIFYDKRSLATIAKEYGLSKTTVHNIKNGKKWTKVTSALVPLDPDP
jgi:hypothetical protein